MARQKHTAVLVIIIPLTRNQLKHGMDGDEDWNTFLKDHPIFRNVGSGTGLANRADISLELSLNTLPDFTTDDINADGPVLSGRRQVMVIKDSDLILAAGSEIRMASLADAKLGHSNASSQKTYKVRISSADLLNPLSHRYKLNASHLYQVLHTPNVGFEIHQMVLNPNGKFLAVAGAFHIAVVVLPRPGFTRLVSASVDCK